jgi:hypothetical protein
MAAAMIASVGQKPAPLRMILGSGALRNTLRVLRERVAGLESQTDLAVSTDFRPGGSAGHKLERSRGWLVTIT